MVRVEKGTKRARDERRTNLERRRDLAVLANATPGGYESPATKRRRLNRRRATSRRFAQAMEELDQLSLQEVAVDSSMAPAGSTDGPGRSTTGPDTDGTDLQAPVQPNRSVSSGTPERAPPARLSDAQRARERRAAMTSSQRDRVKRRDAERKKARRAELRQEQLRAERERHRVVQEQSRERLPPEDQERGREHNTSSRAVVRSQQTEEQRDAERAANREQHERQRSEQSQEHREFQRVLNRDQRERQRSQQTPEQRQEERAANREQHTRHRDGLTQEALQILREADRQQHVYTRSQLTNEERQENLARLRTRRQCVRHGEALANHEDFDVSMVTGPNVVDGRHKLPVTVECPECHAWKWPAESPNSCCLKGQVKLPPLQPAPPRLLQLYGDPHFRENIRAYNQVFAFTSVGASCSNGSFREVQQDRDVAGQRGVYTYRIQGAMGHYLGSLLPYTDPRTGRSAEPKFAQIYFVDPVMESRAHRRQGIFAGLDPVTLLDIEEMMQECNPFAKQFLSMGEQVRALRTENLVDVVFNLHADTRHPGTHNLPVVSEVAATMVEDGNLARPRDILLRTRDHGLMRLFETKPMYDPLQYPLLLPCGEFGWTYTDTYAGGSVRRNKTQMSLREHVAYRLHQKVDDQSALHRGGRLFQQWCVDQRAKCEQEQLRWVAANQKTIRADQYRGVQDALLNESTITLGEGEGLLSEFNTSENRLVHPDRSTEVSRQFLEEVGKRVILPSSHMGSPRAMYKSYQDSMAIVREYGKPDLFLTKTCNPTWDEIVETISLEGYTAQDRPDIVARVWQQKLQTFLQDLNEGILGRVRARIYVVEFQKRGLPHAHILVILADEDKPLTRQLIDKIVSAEIPDKDANPQLYETVMSCMLHGPCGAANPSCTCMKDNKCSKGFPKPFCEVTRSNEKGYPVYRRRQRAEGRLEFKGRVYDNATINQWVVPYNPYLSQKYNCHINVEVCSDIAAVKYLYKYIHKGSDKAMLTIEAVTGDGHSSHREQNEILRFVSARYISPIEACIRLLDFTIQGKTHAVTQLTVHLEDDHMIFFRPTETVDAILNRNHTMLTRFFELCASEAPENQIAKGMLYQDIPKEFCWKGKPPKWVRRKKYQATIGRMVHVSPRDMERFYLRVQLCHRRGPTSFADLRTIDGVLYPTYRDAAKQAGYLADDSEWKSCMSEAATFKMPYQLRQLFATILVYSAPTDVRRLWDAFFPDLSEDKAHRHRELMDPIRSAVVEFETLKSLNDLLQINGYAVIDFDLPQLSDYPRLLTESLEQNNLVRRELTGYDESALREIVSTTDQLNEGQRLIYDQVTQAVHIPEVGKKLFFIDGPGGTGKSTLLRNILASVRLEGKIAIAVASSGIASLLLMGGRTAHSTFKIPLKVDADSTCNIKGQSHVKALIEKASLIIWDEAPMTHRHAFEAVDRTLRDVLKNDEPFGGKIFVLSGDFRQILPVVKKGTPAETIDACLMSSSLWPLFQQVRLTENMRVRSAGTSESAEDMAAFSDFLLRVGEGRHEVNDELGGSYMKIPRDMLIDNPPPTGDADEDEEIRPGAIPRGMARMIDEMYADINNPEVATDEYFANRTILTTTNAVVHRINEAVADRLSGHAREYVSADSAANDEDGSLFEREVLNSLNISGIPPHKLKLKEGMPVMMMRNLNADLGLCNGTRLRIVKLKDHVIHATIMTGDRQGQNVLIPRIVFISDGDVGDFPFQLRRRQFPIQPAFAMTINKAQGQTVQYLGLYLATPCFSHGQLYVAMSRVTARSRFKALIEYPDLEEEDGVYTQNIVYRQIFEGRQQ